MKTVVSTEQFEQSALSQKLGGGSWHQQFVGIQLIDRFARIQRIELNPKGGVGEFRAADNSLDTLLEIGSRLRKE